MENKIYGLFLILINFIQFMDFLLWIDLDNKYGINKIMTILGPIIVLWPPLFMYFIKLYFIKIDFTKIGTFDIIIFLLNFSYFIYFLIIYYHYLKSSRTKITVVNKYGHLTWPWNSYFINFLYILLITVNIFYVTNFNYNLIFFILGGLFFFISYKYFNYNIGELWRVFGNLLPFLMLFISNNFFLF